MKTWITAKNLDEQVRELTRAVSAEERVLCMYFPRETRPTVSEDRPGTTPPLPFSAKKKLERQ